MSNAPVRLAAALALLVSAAPIAGAQNLVVTSPAGAQPASDPAVMDAWFRAGVRAGSTVGITEDYARSGNGSMYMRGDIANTSKADVEYLFGGAVLSPFRLSQLGGLSYDFLRDGSSTSYPHLHAALRMYVDADGDLSTGGDRGYLVYERAYNAGTDQTVDEDVWQTDVIDGTTNLWWRQFGGPGTEEVFNRSLATYQNGAYTPTAGFVGLTGSSLVYGLSVGIGSGWNGTYEGAVDNVGVQIVGAAPVNFNFEVAPISTVPEPATVLLFGTGALALMGLAARRRSAD